MAITKEQAIDILEKFDFFEGQRAGRELWVEKPAEVQEQDISNFSKNVHLLKEYVTSDVAPRAEVDELIYKLECLLCHATGGVLSKHTYDLRTMETVVTDCFNETYNDGYGEGYKDCAREIFEEIDRIREETTAGNIMRLTFFKRLAGLKRKYTEGGQ